MKNIIIIGLVVFIASCDSKDKISNDLVKANLFGDVKSVRIIKNSVSRANIKSEESNILNLYNEQGWLIGQKVFNTDGSILASKSVILDEKGNILEKMNSNAKGEVRDRYTYKYDDRGNKIKDIHFYKGKKRGESFLKYDENDNLLESKSLYKDRWLKTIYKYDESNNLLEEIKDLGDGKTPDKILYNYDKKNNLIKLTNLYGDVKKGVNYTYSYDSKGNQIEKIEYYKSDLRIKITFKYDELGNKIEFKRYDGDKKLLDDEYYTYDASGKLIEEKTYDSWDDVYIIFKYKYDESDNLIESSAYNSDGSLSTHGTYKGDGKGNKIRQDGRRIYEIDYDSKGNWVKKTEFFNGIANTIFIRDIEYYSKSKQDEEIENENIEDYKTLEGTPFHFENYICSRKLFGNDLKALFKNHSFYNGDFHFDVHPYVGAASNGFASFQFIERGSVYEGVIFLSENGEYVYANPVSASVSNRPTVYLFPIQEKGMPFKIKMEVEDEGKKVLSQEILSRCSNYCRLGCSNSD